MNKYNDSNIKTRLKIENDVADFKKKGGRIKKIESGESTDFNEYKKKLADEKKIKIQEQERKAKRKNKAQ